MSGGRLVRFEKRNYIEIDKEIDNNTMDSSAVYQILSCEKNSFFVRFEKINYIEIQEEIDIPKLYLISSQDILKHYLISRYSQTLSHLKNFPNIHLSHLKIFSNIISS